MGIKVGDHIRYNINFFEPGAPVMVRVQPVEEVIVIKTGAGDYEEYLTLAGDYVSEMQLTLDDLDEVA